MKNRTLLCSFPSLLVNIAVGAGCLLAVPSSFSAPEPELAVAAAQPAQNLLGPDDFTGVARTNDSSLNDLLRRLPILPPGMQEGLVDLSAVQEQMMLYERRMRGEGLPEPQRTLFSSNYAAIAAAVVDDRIRMNYGRELLRVHRQLLDRAHFWSASPAPDKKYGEVVTQALEELRDELAHNASPLVRVPVSVRTPMIKGHQFWVEELLHWGSQCRVISRGELGALRIRVARLERFQEYYKRDGYLTRNERENLHRRLLDLNRTLVDALGFTPGVSTPLIY